MNEPTRRHPQIPRPVFREDQQRIFVTAPFHPEFPERARQLHGRMDRKTKTWAFDRLYADHVRRLCRAVFGEDDSPPDAYVTLDVSLKESFAALGRSIHLAGRLVACCLPPEFVLRRGPGIVVHRGDFVDDREIENQPRIAVKPGGVFFQILEVPLPAARSLLQASNPDIERAKISNYHGDRYHLTQRRAALLEELALVDDLLEQLMDDNDD